MITFEVLKENMKHVNTLIGGFYKVVKEPAIEETYSIRHVEYDGLIYFLGTPESVNSYILGMSRIGYDFYVYKTLPYVDRSVDTYPFLEYDKEQLKEN